MATSATNISAVWFDNGAQRGVVDLNGGSYGILAGYNEVDGNMVGRIAFTLEKPTNALSVSWTAGTGTGGKKSFNYSVVPVSEDNGSFKNADSTVTGDGTASCAVSDWKQSSVIISKLLNSGDYYLYIWTTSNSKSNYIGILWNSFYPITVEYEAIAGTASSVAVTGGVMGQPVTMQITRNNAQFVHTLTWAFAGESGTIATKTADTLVKWTPDADTFGAYIPTASSELLTVSCTTYYETEQIGTAQTASLTLYVPADASPTVADGWAVLSHTNEGTAAAGLSACIAGFSKAVVTFDESLVTAKYGARIETLTAKMGGVTVSDSGIIGTVTAKENAVTLTATDSRGKTATQSMVLTAHPYSKPVLSGVTVFRCNGAGKEDDGGAFCSALAAVTHSAAGGEISCTLTAAIKSAGGSYGAETALTPGVTSVLGGWLSDTVSYMVRITAADSLGNSVSVETLIPTAEVAFHIRDGGDGMGLGKYGEISGYIDSAWPIEMNGNKVTGLPDPAQNNDALTLGYANGAFAPAGFGLGLSLSDGGANSYLLTPDTIDSAKKCGWYAYYDSTYVNLMPGIVSHRGLIEVKAWERVTWQYFYGNAMGYVARRYITTEWGSTWSEWEYVNPPMTVGVEYRTTERYQGKAVYVKTFSFGTMPNASTKSIQHGLIPTAIVGLHGTSANGKYFLPCASSSASVGRVDLYIQASSIYVTTTADWSGVNAYITVKYTKD